MKINQLQLYMQDTFAYVGHETVWRNTTPYSFWYVVALASRWSGYKACVSLFIITQKYFLHALNG